MGDIQDGFCSSENAVPDTYYETLYPSLKEDEEYANIMPLTDKTTDVSQKENNQIDQANASPKARSTDGNLWRLKILSIVLMIMIIISTAIISAFIHVLMQRANATDYQLVQVQRPTQLEQVRIEDQFLVQAINTSIIQFKLDQRYDRVMIQTLNYSLQNKTQDLNTRVLFLGAQIAEIAATYKDQEAIISGLEFNLNVANNSRKSLDIRLETIEAQVEHIFQLELGRSKDQVLIQSMNTSIMQLESDQQYDRAMIQTLNSSNTGLLKENHEFKRHISLLDSQIADINVTYKTHEAEVSELKLDSNVTNYSLKFLDTRLQTLEAQAKRIIQLELGLSKDQVLIQSMNTSIMQLESDQQYDRAMIQTLNSSNTGLLRETHELKRQITLLDSQIAKINSTYKAHETKVSELKLDSNVTNYSLKFLDTRLETIEGGLNCSCENWAPFPACSVSCGHGIQFRKRKCENRSVFYSRMWCSRYEIDIQHCTVNCQASDCQEIQQFGLPTSGVYDIGPRGTRKKVSVYCEIDSEGEAWTVIQKRYDGSVDFYRNWTEYKEGFGNPYGEYWIGNEVIHKLSSGGKYTLKIVLTDWNDATKYALYSSFIVSGEEEKYRLNIDGYSGNAGDSMAYHNNKTFSTFDNDNDGYSGNCALNYHGAWWFYYCYYAHLNGRYYNSSKCVYNNCIKWYHWHGYYYSLKATEMMIKRI